LAWLEQVFNRKTKIKAQGKWRLLIIDGHGSHLTQDFLSFCDENRILLFVFPAHSTHTLQPLDVVCFKPLSSACTQALDVFMHITQGYLAIKKGDFFPLFWDAWITSFKEETILKSFEATGIWPKDPERILKRFHCTPRDEEGFPPVTPPPDTSDWRHIRSIAQSAVRDMKSAEAKELIHSLHQMQVKADLSTFENEGLRRALIVRKTQKAKGKNLDIQQRQEYHSSAVIWSPMKLRESRVREAVRLREEE
jgi:hypothetical protein